MRIIKQKGDLMKKTNRKYKHIRRMISVLLVLAVMLSLAVPFNVFAEEEEPATGSEIHAILYYINPGKTAQDGSVDITKNLELVFQRGGTEDPNKTVFKHFTDFADGKNKTASERNPWYREDYNGNKGPVYATNVIKVNIKDKIAPTNMAGWFWQMNQLTENDFLHLDNIDTTKCKTLFYTFCGDKKLTKIDLTCWDLPNLENAGNTFNGCSALTDVNISNWIIPKATYIPGIFANCTSLETIDISSFKINNPYTIGSLFDGCTNLKNVKLFDANPLSETQLAYIFRNCTSLEEVDLSNWNIKKPGTFREMFKGCSSLKSVNFGPAEHWGSSTNFWSYNGWSNSAYESMFEGCTSLESLDLTCVKGALICSSTFKGCTSLKEVNLGYAGIGRENRKGYTYGAPVYPDLSDRANIFEGCEELAWVKLSAEGWPAAGQAGSSVPPKSAWRKIDEPNKDLRLSSDLLFQQFRPEYAGTWVADSFITFKGNGGSPHVQTVDGNRGLELNYDESTVTATRVGYDFTGWWPDKTEEPEGTSPLKSGDIAEHWSYYAHWAPHTYNLVLDGNGGTVPADLTIDGAEISQDRTTITYNNITYPEFVQLSNKLFEKAGKSVLSSWNTRHNGLGTQYYVSDSVNQLTPTQGGTVTLFAQWDEPDYIVTFDSQGGSPVSKKSYKQSNKYGSLPPSEKAGYTFLGWFPENSDTAVKATDSVTGDITLYAHWQENPTVTFDAQNGETPHENIYNYNHKLGVLPVPEWDTRTFMGWFTQDGTTQATPETRVTESTTYYAHWGYQPVFESNGGTYIEYDAQKYEIQDGSQYTISVLPSAEKPHNILDGWYFIYEEGGAQKEEKLSEGDTIDLSKGTIIRAKWTPIDSPVTVTCINKDPDDPDNPKKTVTTAITVYRGNAIRQLPAPTRNGYDFAGWFKENSDTPETAESTFSENTVLYARWNKKDTAIHFNANGGTLVDSSQSTVMVSAGGGIDILPKATLSGKLFAGWYLKDENGDLVEDSRLVSQRALPDNMDHGVTITDNTTYYAKWIDAESLVDDGFFACKAEWSTPNTVDGDNMGDTLVFRPVSGGKITAHLSMAFERKTDKQYHMPVGSIKIKMPASLFKDKNGNAVDTNNINGNDKFSKSTETIDGVDYYVYTNTVELNEDSGFEFHYSVDPTKLAAKSGDDLFYKNDFKVYIQYHDDNHTVDYEREMGVEVHTKIDAKVNKSQSAVSLVWEPEWGTKPADADEYFYVTWNLSAVISNCTQKYKLRWSEDTAHDGTIIYKSSNLDEWSDELTGGTTVATVVTKHKRSEVHSEDSWYTVKNEAILDIEMASGEQYHYRPTATATAYIPASEGSSSHSGTGDPYVITHDNQDHIVSKFAKTIKADYTAQQNHTVGYAQEYVLNDNAAALVPLDYTIDYKEERNTDSGITWSDKTNTYHTAERTMLLSDGNDGDLRISKVEGNNRYKWGDSSIEQNLNPSDYSFTYLKIWLTEYDAVKMGDTWSNTFAHRAEDYDDIVVRVRTTTNSNLEIVPINDADDLNDYVEVTLPEGTYYYEVEHKSSFYTTDIKVETSVKLNISNRLKSIVSDHVEDSCKTLIKNKSNIDITRNGNKQSVSSEKTEDAWPAAYELTKGSSTLYTFKRCAPNKGNNIVHDPSTSTETFPVLLTAWNYNTGVNSKFMKSGEFNDLLPHECIVNKDSVFVQRRENNQNITNLSSDTVIDNAIAVKPENYDSEKAKNTVLPADYYSVVLTPDWQGSGRTMMTVKITVPEDKTATGFNVYYKMKTSYSNINRRGTHLMNSTSFTDTTKKQSKPNVKINTIDLLDSDTKHYYTSIDDEFTAFAKAQTDCAVPSIYTYGITSLVQAEGSKLTEHEIVGINTNYFYNINYCNNSITTDLVFFDTIEKRLDDQASEWQGTFVGIDVSQMKDVITANSVDGKCEPVVYYTTKDRSLLTKDDLTLDSDIWSQTPPAQLSDVTAVAVDCRKTDTGKDFVLPKKTNLAFNIDMHSPKDNINNDDITYNEAVVNGEIVDNNMRFQSHTYTDVTIKFTEPEFSKTAFPITGTESAPAEVVGNSVLTYYLKIKNHDEVIPMHNIMVEDDFDKSFNFNNPITVQIDNGAELGIDNAAHINSYSIDPVKVGDEDKFRFSAVIDYIDPGETITIKIPVTVPAEVGTVLKNKARITSVDGVNYREPVESDETFHKVTGTKAKILKIKSNGSALPGAELQIFENNSTNFDPTTGKIKDGAVAMVLTNNEVVVGEGADHDYFTSTNEVHSFDISPGDYVLHEKTLPTGYETPAADIPFRVDIEGIHYIKKNNKEEMVSQIEMTNVAPYQVIYHINPPTGADQIYKTFDSVDLDEKKVPEFLDFPEFTGDTYYSFMGWYTQPSGGEKVTFDRTYEATTHLYAHWQAYKVIFHENNPEINDKDVVFKTYDPSQGQLNARHGIDHFYDIPAWAGDEYVFAGWYHNSDYSKTTEGINTPADFEKDAYPKRAQVTDDPDYHLYAKWIKVGTVSQSGDDTNNYGGVPLRGFGLAGVQIREPQMNDSNFNDEITPGGLRFVTSFSEDLLGQVNSIDKIEHASAEAKSFGVEYGYVVGTKTNIDSYASHYKVTNNSSYKLQYNGENVNGVDTTGKTYTAATDYRYIKNVDCTSRVAPNSGTAVNGGVVALDHRNFDNYRLYTLIVTYENDEESKSKTLDARSYMRYYDANGKLRVFYNNYNNNASY